MHHKRNGELQHATVKEVATYRSTIKDTKVICDTQLYCRHLHVALANLVCHVHVI
jgi:hypothetical protein